MNPSSPARPFYTLVREERQFSFLLAHLLMQRGPNLGRFVGLINDLLPPATGPLPLDQLDEAEIYVEYAYLRDHWDSILKGTQENGRLTPRGRRKANEEKRAFILQLFRRVPSLQELAASNLPADPASFNAHFMGIAGSRITGDVASPALWSVKALKEGFGTNRDVFRDLCKLKWSFRIKPDLVIWIPGAPILCIEAKLESGEGTYPTGGEAKIFDEVLGARVRVGQFELQKFMFSTLMATPCVPVVIQKREPSGQPDCPTLTWAAVLDTLATAEELNKSIPFVNRLISENSALRARSSQA